MNGVGFKERFQPKMNSTAESTAVSSVAASFLSTSGGLLSTLGAAIVGTKTASSTPSCTSPSAKKSSRKQSASSTPSGLRSHSVEKAARTVGTSSAVGKKKRMLAKKKTPKKKNPLSKATQVRTGPSTKDPKAILAEALLMLDDDDDDVEDVTPPGAAFQCASANRCMMKGMPLEPKLVLNCYKCKGQIHSALCASNTQRTGRTWCKSCWPNDAAGAAFYGPEAAAIMGRLKVTDVAENTIEQPTKGVVEGSIEQVTKDANGDSIQTNGMTTPPSKGRRPPSSTGKEQRKATAKRKAAPQEIRTSPPNTTIYSTSTNKPKQKATKMTKGCRVSIQRKNLVPILNTEDRGKYDRQIECLPRSYPDSAYFYGTVIGGTGNAGYSVRFDCFPDDCNVIVCRRGRIRVLAKGEDEPPLSEKLSAALDAKQEAIRLKMRSEELKSESAFCKLPADDLKTAKTFVCSLQKNQGEEVEWNILQEQEHIRNCPKYKRCKENAQPKFSKKIDRTKGVHENFFELVWPDMKGKAKTVDEYLSDPRASYHATYSAENMRFHDESADDQDWKIKQCIMVLIAAATEFETGYNLWKAGPGMGRKALPDFGKYVSEHELKCFISVAPFLFADKRWWFEDKRDIQWDMFNATVKKFNERRQQLLVSFLLMLDESMIAWKPKTSKFGGLPNITYKPRKPIDLGTMLRAATECVLALQVSLRL